MPAKQVFDPKIEEKMVLWSLLNQAGNGANGLKMIHLGPDVYNVIPGTPAKNCPREMPGDQ